MKTGIREIRSAGGKRLPKPLLTPIKFTINVNVLAAHDNPDVVQGPDALGKVRMKRLRALAEHFGAEYRESGRNPYFFEYAFYKLAIEFIPGFQLAPLTSRVGRPRKWDSETRGHLLREVLDIKAAKPRATDLSACKELVRLGKYQDGSAKVTTAETLRNQLSLARQDPVAVDMATGGTSSAFKGT